MGPNCTRSKVAPVWFVIVSRIASLQCELGARAAVHVRLPVHFTCFAVRFQSLTVALAWPWTPCQCVILIMTGLSPSRDIHGSFCTFLDRSLTLTVTEKLLFVFLLFLRKNVFSGYLTSYVNCMWRCQNSDTNGLKLEHRHTSGNKVNVFYA